MYRGQANFAKQRCCGACLDYLQFEMAFTLSVQYFNVMQLNHGVQSHVGLAITVLAACHSFHACHLSTLHLTAPGMYARHVMGHLHQSADPCEGRKPKRYFTVPRKTQSRSSD